MYSESPYPFMNDMRQGEFSERTFDRPSDIPGFVLDFERVHDVHDTKKFHRLVEQYGLNMEQAHTFIEYLENLDINIDEDIKDKKVLDVGSGSGWFKQALERIAGRQDLVNLDESPFRQDEVDVRAKAEALPFKAESFDTVVAHCSVPIIQSSSGNFELIPETVREFVRVTKPGGKVKIYPIYSNHSTHKSHMYSLVMNEIERLHAEIPGLKIKILELIDDTEITKEGQSWTRRAVTIEKPSKSN